MGRIGDAFARAEAEGRPALVIYLCGGFPNLGITADLVVAAAEAGADVIELGVPFSDPTADGVAIQRASETALAAGASLKGVLEVVAEVRKRSEVPILLFGYYNPIVAYGERSLAEEGARIGVDGCLVVDLPPEESAPLRDPLVERGLDFVPLVAPTSAESRITLAGDHATSFVYYVSMTGVTGAKAADLGSAAARAAEVQKQLGKPVALGFGVKTADDVRTVAPHVAGVVVGSAVVRAIDAATDDAAAVDAVSTLVADLASGLRPA